MQRNPLRVVQGPEAHVESEFQGKLDDCRRFKREQWRDKRLGWTRSRLLVLEWGRIPGDAQETMTSENPNLPAGFHDRGMGLTVIGALTILLGCLIALTVPAMIFGQAMAPPMAGPRPSIIPGIVINGGFSVILIWLGVGSFLARRWARALLLILGWSGLVMGLVMVPAVAFLIPQFARLSPPAGGAPLPPGVLEGAVVFVILLLGFFFILIPGIWVLFYGSRNVKATCEARNPKPSWTDACPLPVLALSLWLVAGIPMMFTTPFSYGAVLPFFGVFLSGWAGIAGYLVLTTAWAMAAWGIYRLDIRGWWLILVALILLGVSSFVTYARNDISVMYELMGLPASQIEQMRHLPGFSANGMKWILTATFVPMVAYLVAIRRFFRRAD